MHIIHHYINNNQHNMAQTKQQKIARWHELDDQIKAIRSSLKALVDEQKMISDDLVVDDEFKEETLSDGSKLQLMHTVKYEGLTFKYLEKTLPSIIKSTEHCNSIIEQIKTRRTSERCPYVKRVMSEE